MKKNLTVLCLFAVFSSFSFASDLSSDDDPLLSSRATAFFEQGDLGQERVTRVEILRRRPTPRSFSLAIHSCVIIEKFDAAEGLLRNYKMYVDPFLAKSLEFYIQDEKIKLEDRTVVRHQMAQSQGLRKKFSQFFSFLRKTR